MNADEDCSFQPVTYTPWDEKERDSLTKVKKDTQDKWIHKKWAQTTIK